MSIRFLAALLLMTPALHAANPKEEFDPKKIDQIIHQAYKDAMEMKFVEIVNAAKKQKNAAEFFAEINHLPEQGRKDLRELLGDTPVPRLLPVHNGLKFTLNDQSVTIEFTEALGEIKMNGAKLEIPAKKTLKQLATQEAGTTAFNWRIQFLPEAHAGALKAVGKLAWGTIKWAAAGTATGIAAGAGIGAAEGCLISIHTKSDYKSYSDACGDGAAMGSSYLMGALGGLTFGGLGGYFGFGMAEIDLNWEERTALQNAGKTLKPLLWRGIKLAGTAGALALLVHGANELSYMNGVIVKCGYGSGYKVTGLNGGAQKALYDSRDGGISLGWGYLNSPEELAKKLGDKFPKSTDEQRKIISQQIWTEHLAMTDTCKQNPGKEYRIRSSDAKKIDEPPAPPAETKQ